ncbi:hypothetical protein JOM56_000710 [Amanita muscaria]
MPTASKYRFPQSQRPEEEETVSDSQEGSETEDESIHSANGYEPHDDSSLINRRRAPPNHHGRLLQLQQNEELPAAGGETKAEISGLEPEDAVEGEKAGKLEAKPCCVDQGVQTDPVLQRETLLVDKQVQDGADQRDGVEASIASRPFTSPNIGSKDLKVLMRPAGEGNKRSRGVEVSVQLKRQKLGEEFVVKVVY